MNSKKFFEAMSELDNKYIEEAIYYKKKTTKPVWIKLGAIAACLALAFAVGSILAPFQGSMIVSAYAHGTDEEITAAGAVMNSGTINDKGEMKGHPLMFYLSGKNIKTVRFSCKNQQISFMDWTEKREEYGNAQNFTVTYGEDESDYYYLTIDWVPNTIIRELTDHAETTIATLPAEMREDIIVMEITFANGKTVTKAITVSLLEDGTFFASFDDYEITAEDNFIERMDSESIPQGIEQNPPSIVDESAQNEDKNTITVWTAEQMEAAKQSALAYYENTVFSVNTIEYIEEKLPYGDIENSCNFIVNVSMDIL